MKTCASCKEEKLETEFSKLARAKDGLQYYCKPCAVASAMAAYRKNPIGKLLYIKDWKKKNLKKVQRYKKAWNDNNPDACRAHKRTGRSRLWEKVFSHYGKSCACCGENTKEFLTIDHVNGGGNKDRREHVHRNLYSWLVNNDFPGGFQTLCRNCNWGKHVNGGMCPHARVELKIVGGGNY